MSLLKLREVCKTFPAAEKKALDHVTFDLSSGQILSLLGPSGCGKTTLLRTIAGLEAADAGEVIFNGKNLAGLPCHVRRFGMMFQEFALFPHQNVFENVAFGLRMQNLADTQIVRRTGDMLALVGLTGLSRRRVDQLSGGERQRVALARCLAPEPRLLMLDEPLGALDRELRERLLPEIRRILMQVGITTLMVTHDQTEALAVADQVAVLHEGRLVQMDGPEKLYRQPANPWVAGFLGFHNLLPGRLAEKGGVETDLGIFHPADIDPVPRKTSVLLLIRPEAASLTSAHFPKPQKISGQVVERLFQGRGFRLTLKTSSGCKLEFDLPNDPLPPPLHAEIELFLSAAGMAVIA